ncbi:hypothetical protein [Brevundimonas sp.]|uniref:hypothetical protein n=1 Tax=Brevundimonas sp. TaxID=1871086 RepID=UPI0028A23B76|nr:hypothetical protein [Brevundimonas sp.]
MNQLGKLWGPLVRAFAIWLAVLALMNTLAHFFGVGVPWIIVPFAALLMTFGMAAII